MKAGKGSVTRNPEVEAEVEEEWMDATRDEVGACLSSACGDADGWMGRGSGRRTGRRVASAQPRSPWKKTTRRVGLERPDQNRAAQRARSAEAKCVRPQGTRSTPLALATEPRSRRARGDSAVERGSHPRIHPSIQPVASTRMVAVAPSRQATANKAQRDEKLVHSTCSSVPPRVCACRR